MIQHEIPSIQNTMHEAKDRDKLVYCCIAHPKTILTKMIKNCLNALKGFPIQTSSMSK